MEVFKKVLGYMYIILNFDLNFISVVGDDIYLT